MHVRRAKTWDLCGDLAWDLAQAKIRGHFGSKAHRWPAHGHEIVTALGLG